MRTKAAFVALSMLPMAELHAQSSVTIQGLIDAGVSYVSNEHGSANTKFDDGIGVPNLLMITGREDLGGGNAAIFNLTNQFSLGTGSFITGQSLFSRNAYVGLRSERLGTLTVGNQYDFMPDSLFYSGDDAAYYSGGLYGFRNGPFAKLALPNNPTGSYNWDRLAGASGRVQNSVKYLSSSFDGFSAGILYGFGGVAGSFGSDSTMSFGLNFRSGTFGANAAYTDVKYGGSAGQASVRNWGVGTHYTLSGLTLTALLTTVRNTANDGAVWDAEVGSSYLFGLWSLSGAYMYMKGNQIVDNNHAHQGSLTLSYFLSKRSTVYASAVYQRANEGANALINGVLDANGASSSPTQAIARVGLTTRF